MGQSADFARSPIGIFAFSEGGELLFFRLFSKNPEKALQEFERIKPAEVTELKQYSVKETPEAYQLLRKNFRDYAKSLGFAETDEELNRFLSSFFTLLSRKKLSGAIGRDKLLVQATNGLDDINKVTSLFHERLYEWYSLHYPEMRNTKDLASRIIKAGRRDRFPEFKQSTGVDLTEKDEEILVEFAKTLQTLYEEKEKQEEYVRKAVREIAPTVSSIVDPLMAARLISTAGSLEKLARMPASTIQLLGAEKALFRHLHNRGKSPKYGVLYMSSLIQNAKPEDRGKVARILSAQLMKASKIDFYSGRYEPKLKEEMDEEMKKL